MSYEEIRQADEDDRRDWLAAREDEVRAVVDEGCPVCDGTGYTDGVRVRHPCPNCNPEFRLDRATDRLVEVGTETPVPAAGREGRGEVLTQRESQAMTRTLRWYGSLPGGHAEFYQDVDDLRLAGRAALQERLEAACEQRDAALLAYENAAAGIAIERARAILDRIEKEAS